MFIAFSMLLVVLAMSAFAPMRTWRAVFGVAAAPSWKLALGLWIAAFGAGLFVLTLHFRRRAAARVERARRIGELARGSLDILHLGLWPGRRRRGLRRDALQRVGTSPGDASGFPDGRYLRRLHRLGCRVRRGLSGIVDINGQNFAIGQLFPHANKLDLSMGFIFTAHKKAALHAGDVGALIGTPGSAVFLLMRGVLVVVAMLAALALSGPRVAPLVVRSRKRGPSAFASALSARFGLTGVIVGQTWSAPLWALILAAAAVAAEAF